MKCVTLFLVIYLACALAKKYDSEWWKYTNIYEIYVPVYKDSDGDGVGDFQGIKSELKHLVDLGIETVYLLPIYESTMQDMGFDVTNYYNTNPQYGTMEDFESLLAEMNALGLKLILDLPINHSGDEHEWFKKSVQRIDPFTDYYVWEDPIYDSDTGIKNPPNDWPSIFRSSAWTYNENRKQFYYHMFLPEQPDLNYRNPKVFKEILEIMSYWLNKGIAGFKLDAPAWYVEDEYLKQDDGQWGLRESYVIMHELREFMDEYNRIHGGFERILIPESHGDPSISSHYLGTKVYPVCHFAFSYHFEYPTHELSASEIDGILQNWLGTFAKERIAWMTQDHDQSRVGSRIKDSYKDILTIVTALAPGILHIYYGQEIGLIDGIVLPSQIKDFSGDGARDPNRLLMQWDDSTSAGFSSNYTTYSPMCLDYVTRNVKIQKREKISHYNLMKSLLALRKTKTVKYGKFHSHVYSEYAYIFWRSFRKQPTIIVVLNLDLEDNKINIKKAIVPASGILRVITASINSDYQKGYIVSCHDNCVINMKPQSAIVFTSEELKSSIDVL